MVNVGSAQVGGSRECKSEEKERWEGDPPKKIYILFLQNFNMVFT